MSLIRVFTTTAMIALFMSFTAHAATQCRPPLAPAIPDSQTATKAQVLEALKMIKNTFQPAIKNFQHCISTEKQAVGDVATERQIAEWDQLFDAAYALETQVANKMNETIRGYKARAAAEKKAE